MKRYLAVLAAMAIAYAAAMSQHASAQAKQPASKKAAVTPPTNPCAMPAMPAPTPEETAWRLFVAASCPSNGQLAWEHWIEQLDLYPASGTAGAAASHSRLHGSPLERATRLKTVAAPQLEPSSECNKMKAPPTMNPPLAKTIICEEARLSPDAQKFVTSNGYQVRSGQTQAAQKGTNIQFPRTAVEIKADWVPAEDFVSPGFSCSSPQTAVYTEMIDGKCYALAGMHISSKLWPNWIWATFEPQNPQTNPNRCVTFGPCHDKWGATPSSSTGGNTTLTQPLKALMTQAKLPAALLNYRMDGVQVAFGTAQNPTLLGNSVIEGENVGMQKGTASCITCHSVSTIKTDGTDGISLIQNQVGPKFVPPAGYIARDFVWSLALACPNGIQNCAPGK